MRADGMWLRKALLDRCTQNMAGGVVGPERGQVCSLKRQLLGLALEDEGGQAGTQNKRSARVLRRKTLRQVFGKG